jgi:hypothetical protein
VKFFSLEHLMVLLATVAVCAHQYVVGELHYIDAAILYGVILANMRMMIGEKK